MHHHPTPSLKRHFYVLFLAAFVFIVPIKSFTQCTANIDLNTWTIEGPPGNGNWSVNGPGTQVTQLVNSEPTFFVSPQDFINVRINGTIQVNTSGDDDFVGFVFGYQDPLSQPGPYDIDTWLFDWKQGNQTVAGQFVNQGQYLAQVNMTNNNLNGIANYTTTFWGHVDQPVFDIVASNTGAGTGWTDFTVYNFTLTYLSTRAIIVVNGDTIFDIPGCYVPGRFGFYNYSQSSVIYSNFSYELIPDFSMATTNVCLNDSAQFFYVVDTCATVGFVNPLVASWVWDFGDGTFGTGQTVNHLYPAIGNYTVKLIVTDSLGCSDSTTNSVTILPVPPQPNGSGNTPLCEGDTLNLTAASGIPLVTYDWTGPNGFAANNAQSPNIDGVTPPDSGDYYVTVTLGPCSSDPDTVPIVIHALPPSPVPGSNSPICTDSSLNLTATAVSNSTYNWTGPNSYISSVQNPVVNNVTAVNAGMYYVSATRNNCDGPNDSVNVVINPTPVAVISGDTTICLGDTAILAVSGGLSQLWSSANTTVLDSFSPALTGPVSVTVFDADACPSLPVSRTIVVSPHPTPFVGNDTTVCDSLQLDAGAGFLDYLWTGGGTAQTQMVYLSGQYIVTVLSVDSCYGSDTINVTVNNTPAAPTASSNSPICTDSTLDLTASGIVGATYNWTGPSGFTSGLASPSITNITAVQAGIYSVTATLNACTGPAATTNVVVNPTPITLISGDTTICIGDNAILSATGGNTYNWSTGGNTALETFTPLVTGIVSVIAFDPDGCPSLPDQVNVIVNPLPVPNIGPDTTVCDSLSLDAGPGYLEYLWSDNSTNQNLTVTLPGMYWVEVMNTDSCYGRDTVVIGVFSTALVDLGPDSDFCVGDSIILQASPASLTGHVWSTGQSAGLPFETVFTTGSFWVQANDPNGCISRDTIIVGNYPLLSGDIGNDTTLCAGTFMILDASSFAGATYLWSPGSSSGQTLLANSPALYSVIVDDGNGCLYHDTVLVSYDIPPTLTMTSTSNLICQGQPVTFIVNPAIMPEFIFYDGGNVAQSGPSPTWSTTSLAPGNLITVVGVSALGCTTAVAGPLSVSVVPRPTGAVTVDGVCDGDATVFTLVSPPGLTIVWSGQDGLAGSTSVLSHTYSAPGIYNWSVNLDNGVCDTTINGIAVVHAIPAMPTTQDTLVCLGQTSPLFAQGADVLEWFEVATGGTLVGVGPLYDPGILTQDATFWVHSTLNGCESPRASATVTVSQPPFADFISSPDADTLLYLPNTTVSFVDLSTGGATAWSWDFGDGGSASVQHPAYQYLDEGQFSVTLTVENSDGCPDTITRGIYEIEDLFRVYIPNAFSPNGDGLNDDFRIFSVGASSYQILIFDRWGKLMFDNGGNPEQYWDGKFSGKLLSEGVYVYRIAVTDWRGGEHERRGSVTLIR